MRRATIRGSQAVMNRCIQGCASTGTPVAGARKGTRARPNRGRARSIHRFRIRKIIDATSRKATKGDQPTRASIQSLRVIGIVDRHCAFAGEEEGLFGNIRKDRERERERERWENPSGDPCLDRAAVHGLRLRAGDQSCPLELLEDAGHALHEPAMGRGARGAFPDPVRDGAATG